MVHRTLTRIAVGLAGAFALTVAVPTSACDCDGKPKVAAATENAPAAVAMDDEAKDSGPCTCPDSTAAAVRPEASAAASGPSLDLQFWWMKPQDGC